MQEFYCGHCLTSFAAIGLSTASLQDVTGIVAGWLIYASLAARQVAAGLPASYNCNSGLGLLLLPPMQHCKQHSTVVLHCLLPQ